MLIQCKNFYHNPKMRQLLYGLIICRSWDSIRDSWGPQRHSMREYVYGLVYALEGRALWILGYINEWSIYWSFHAHIMLKMALAFVLSWCHLRRHLGPHYLIINVFTILICFHVALATLRILKAIEARIGWNKVGQVSPWSAFVVVRGDYAEYELGCGVDLKDLEVENLPVRLM